MIKEGYDVVSPIPTCTLMLNEYPRVLGREVPKAHDAMEYLLKLVNEGKVQIKGKLEKSVAYHPPHLKYLRVGYPVVRLMRSLGLKVETSNKGCSGMDGGWGLRNYETAKRRHRGTVLISITQPTRRFRSDGHAIKVVDLGRPAYSIHRMIADRPVYAYLAFLTAVEAITE